MTIMTLLENIFNKIYEHCIYKNQINAFSKESIIENPRKEELKEFLDHLSKLYCDKLSNLVLFVQKNDVCKESMKKKKSNFFRQKSAKTVKLNKLILSIRNIELWAEETFKSITNMYSFSLLKMRSCIIKEIKNPDN
ncbi:hypothetical protein EDEG_01902 [Edhazardia aedis USNM 41457]|uniref:Uncharacterized protein n=1 Tax=Edhazardia aedis (strain USNM 41457) TaxID=1003232 RepID=J9DMI4_EDHAE|nr:hypothetical protein EDEG_01902 [Edhazardia aedis USNM 41457]|eukprot:EJW03810.1 hypothetical protein EDEG_01902 [Edhazardia aedis USNM 41457]